MTAPEQDLHVTTIQSDLIWEDHQANLEAFGEKLKSLDTATDLIILPEMFNTGFSMEVSRLAEPMDGETMHWMKVQAKACDAVIVGSLIVEEGLNYFNRLVWMRPDGTFETYDKRHLFRMADEDQYFQSGQKRLITELKGWRVCPQVCYDLRFPVWQRNQQDYDVLLVIANWPERRSLHWRSLLLSRAIENQAYVVGVNRVGQDGNEINYRGDTAVISAKGDYLYERAHKPEVVTTLLEAKPLQHYREKFPVWRDADQFDIKN